MSASNKENNTNSNDVTIDLESPWLVVFLAYAAFAEELMFRFLPLVIIFSIIKRVLPNVNIFSRLLLIVASSFLFGISHGGLDHLLVQGVAGVVLCIVFLKCGGAAEKVSYESSYIRANLRGLLCSIFTHFWINYIIIIMDIVFFGMRYVTLHS